MYRRLGFFYLFIFFLPIMLTAQVNVLLDPDVRTGTLDNGIQFYLWKQGSNGRIEMRLVVQAGSNQET